MATLGTLDGRPAFRFPKPLWNGLFRLHMQGGQPMWQTHFMALGMGSEMERWKLIKKVTMRDPEAPGPDDRPNMGAGYLLTEYGKMLAALPTHEVIDRRTMIPLLPLADLLRALPEPIRDWLAKTPIEKNEGGMLFVALGVLVEPAVGDHLLPSRHLIEALTEPATGGDGPVAGVPEFLSKEQKGWLRSTLAGGMAWDANKLDGRRIKPMIMMGLVQWHEPERRWTVAPSMRRFVNELSAGTRDPVALFLALSSTTQDYLTTGLMSDDTGVPLHLLQKMGWLYKSGNSYEYRLSKIGQGLAPSWRAAMRAAAGVLDGDIGPDTGQGADLTLEDEDGPADFSMLDVDTYSRAPLRSVPNDITISRVEHTPSGGTHVIFDISLEDDDPFDIL